ncbi:zinc ribbon domain-containing protein [Shewanella baltica]|uniref:zinc ribbon domain-containing protein n=1 Tax=Shewanella baltica TaxID=62322 RepID=UPI00217CC6AB|nr:zinc ribbon domain-containing protein [Shewanella baltica]
MALVKCKECGKDVSTSAKVCPHCGIKSPGVKASDALKGFALIFVVIFIVAQCSDSDESSKTDSANQTGDVTYDKSWPGAISSLVTFAKPYSIADAYDYSFAGRKRIEWTITAPEATTYEAYLGTAISAAKKLATEHRVNQATVFIAPNSKLIRLGYNLAAVTYTVDGKGNAGQDFDGVYWKAEAAQEPLSDQTIKITEMWYDNRAKFQNANGLTDEPKLVKFIADKLDIAESDVHLPWINSTKLAL